jgi:hypothetical protein
MELKDINEIKFVACKYTVMHLTYFYKIDVRGQAMPYVLWQLPYVSGVDCLCTAHALNHM